MRCLTTRVSSSGREAELRRAFGIPARTAFFSVYRFDCIALTSQAAMGRQLLHRPVMFEWAVLAGRLSRKGGALA